MSRDKRPFKEWLATYANLDTRYILARDLQEAYENACEMYGARAIECREIVNQN